MKFAGRNLIYLSNDEYNEIKCLKEKKYDISAPPNVSKENRITKENKNSPKITNKNKLTDETNINIFTFQNESILTEVPLIPDIPKRCEKCMSILNNFSKLNNIVNNKYEWICEFCFTKNIIEIINNLIPTTPTIEYIIEKSTKEETEDLSQRSIIFCLDISGSMNTSFIEKNDVTISRLEIIKGTVIKNLKEINKKNPNYKVGLVTFESEVIAYGDGDHNIFLEELDDEEKIIKTGLFNKNIISKPIKDSYNKLFETISNLEDKGCTALGPSVLFSLSLLMDKNNNGRIFLCTDGFANLGVGSFDGDLEKSTKFYKKIGEMAKNRGICINLITFSDSESNIQVLMNMVQKTGGEIIQFNPNENLEEIDSFLNRDIIASQTQLQIKLNKVLEFIHKEKNNLDYNGSSYYKFIGNIKKDINPYFCFKFKSLKEISLMPDINLVNLSEIPFQTIIEYKDLNGNKKIRIFTELKKICTNKNEILKKADFEIISSYAIQMTSNLLLKGKYDEVIKESETFNEFFNVNRAMNNSSKHTYEYATKSIRQNAMNSTTIKNNYNDYISDKIIYESFKSVSIPEMSRKAAPNVFGRRDVFDYQNYKDFQLKPNNPYYPISFPVNSQKKPKDVDKDNKKIFNPKNTDIFSLFNSEIPKSNRILNTMRFNDTFKKKYNNDKEKKIDLFRSFNFKKNPYSQVNHSLNIKSNGSNKKFEHLKKRFNERMLTPRIRPLTSDPRKKK